MASAVSVTFPADNVAVSKATMRSQFQTISDEISALQTRVALPGAEAFNDSNITRTTVMQLIRRYANNLARDIAFARVDM